MRWLFGNKIPTSERDLDREVMRTLPRTCNESKEEGSGSQGGTDFQAPFIDHTQQIHTGLVFKAHRLEYHSTLGWRVIKKKKIDTGGQRHRWWVSGA